MKAPGALTTGAARFAGGLLVGAALVTVLHAPLVTATCAVLNTLVFDHVRFGSSSAHARLRPAQATGVDTEAALVVDGYAGELAVGFNLRRDLLLPLALLLAAVVAAPLPTRRRAICLATGAPVLFAFVGGCIGLLVLWSFAFQLRGVLALGETSRQLLDVAYRALLLPPANRFVFPLVLAAALWQWQAQPGAREADFVPRV